MKTYLKKRIEKWRNKEKDKWFDDVIVIKVCKSENDQVITDLVLSKTNVEFLEKAIRDYHLKDELERGLVKLRTQIHNSQTTKGVKCRK